MDTGFAQLKRTRGSVEEIQKQVEKLTQNTFEKDTRFWYPKTDRAGNGSALIRFLPAPPGEDHAFIRFWVHSFKNPKTNLWYIENCLTSIGKPDPVTDFNSELFKTSDDKNSPARKQVSLQKRKLQYVSNIYVVKDPATPENDGKVFLYKYGAKVFDKINMMLNPPEDGLGEKTKINPFDLWEGANFRLIVHKEDGFPRYDRSAFDSQGPLMDGGIPLSDTQLEGIWKSEYPLQPFIDPSNYKSYDELQKKLHRVLGISGAAPSNSSEIPRAAYTAPPTAAAPSYPEEETDGDPEDLESFFNKFKRK